MSQPLIEMLEQERTRIGKYSIRPTDFLYNIMLQLLIEADNYLVKYGAADLRVAEEDINPIMDLIEELTFYK
jgi:hypothetical protein